MGDPVEEQQRIDRLLKVRRELKYKGDELKRKANDRVDATMKAKAINAAGTVLRSSGVAGTETEGNPDSKGPALAQLNLPLESLINDSNEKANVSVLRDPKSKAIIAVVHQDPINGSVSVDARDGVVVAVDNDGKLTAKYNKQSLDFETADGKKTEPQISSERMLFFSGTSTASMLDLSKYTADKQLNVSLLPLDPTKPAQGSASVFVGKDTSIIAVDATAMGRDNNLGHSPHIIIPDTMATGATASQTTVGSGKDKTQLVQVELGNSNNSLKLGPERLPSEQGKAADQVYANYKMVVYNANGNGRSQDRHVTLDGRGTDLIAQAREEMRSDNPAKTPAAKTIVDMLESMATAVQAAFKSTLQQGRGGRE